jgi:hypothetical protein
MNRDREVPPRTKPAQRISKNIIQRKEIPAVPLIRVERKLPEEELIQITRADQKASDLFKSCKGQRKLAFFYACISKYLLPIDEHSYGN